MPEFTPTQLELAFRWYVATEMLDADFERTETEEDWFATACPTEALASAGFIGPNGDHTPTYERCLGEALVTLPDALSHGEKIRVLRDLLRGGLADDEFHHEEGKVLMKAAMLLGVPYSALFDSLDEVGEVDLDESDDWSRGPFRGSDV